MQKFTKLKPSAFSTPCLYLPLFANLEQEQWIVNKTSSFDSDILIRPNEPSPRACTQLPLVDSTKYSPFAKFQKSLSLSDIALKREVLSEEESQFNINSSAISTSRQCASYPRVLLNSKEEIVQKPVISDTNEFCHTKTLTINDGFGLTFSHTITTNQLTQVTGITETISSPFASSSTSSCSLLLSDEDHELIYSVLDKSDNNVENSNNNNCKNTMTVETIRTQTELPAATINTEDWNTNSSSSPSAKQILKSVLLDHAEKLNDIKKTELCTHEQEKQPPFELETTGTLAVDHLCNDDQTDASATKVSSSKIEEVVISSSDCYPDSNGDDSDDSDMYIRRRLVEINAKFAQEPLPSDTKSSRETKVTFRKQLVDVVAISPEWSSQEQSDESGQCTGTFKQVLEHCDDNRSQKPPEPFIHEELTNLHNAQVTVPIVETNNIAQKTCSPKPTQSGLLEFEDHVTTKTKQETDKRILSLPSTSRRPRTTESGTVKNENISGSGKHSVKSAHSCKQSGLAPTFTPSSVRARPKSARQIPLGGEKRSKTGSPSTNAVQIWIEEKNRIQRAKRRAELEQQSKKEEELKQQQALHEELREKQWHAWLKSKSKQLRQERELKQRQEVERTYFTVTHTRKDCEKAFQEWLQRKAAEQQQKVREARQRLKITRQLIRRCQATQRMTWVIDQAKIYRLL